MAPLLELYRALGHAARKGLWLSERHTEAQVREAARRAALLSRHEKKD